MPECLHRAYRIRIALSWPNLLGAKHKKRNNFNHAKNYHRYNYLKSYTSRMLTARKSVKFKREIHM